MTSKDRARWFATCILFILLSSCSSYEDIGEKREKIAMSPQTDLKIGVLWSYRYYPDGFIRGIMLAAEEVNERGGVFGKKIKILYYDDRGNYERSLSIARSFAKDPEIIAVIGNRYSANAIPASIIYEKAKLLFLACGATGVDLTSHRLLFTFRLIPSDIVMSSLTALQMKKMGHKKISVIDDRTTFGRGLADIFIEKAFFLNLDILDRRSFSPDDTDMKPLFAQLRNESFDAIFISGHLPGTARAIKQAREMGITSRFFGNFLMDSHFLWEVGGAATEGTIIPTDFNPFYEAPETRTFVERYMNQYKEYPDSWAALGYDALNILVHTYNKANSVVPIVAASYLRYTKDWKGANGSFNFSEQGDMIDTEMFFKTVKDGRFQYLPDIVSMKDVETEMRKIARETGINYY